jgi:hypothetical protein
MSTGLKPLPQSALQSDAPGTVIELTSGNAPRTCEGCMGPAAFHVCLPGEYAEFVCRDCFRETGTEDYRG